MQKTKIISIILSLLLLSGIVMVMGTDLRAESKTNNSDKLDKILEQQKDILQKIDSIKEELETIKMNTNRC